MWSKSNDHFSLAGAAAAARIVSLGPANYGQIVGQGSTGVDVQSSLLNTFTLEFEVCIIPAN